MKTSVLFFILYLGWTLSVLVNAAEKSSSVKPGNTNLDADIETAKFDDTNELFRTKRSGDKKPFGNILNSLFSKKLGLLGPLSSISSSSSSSGKNFESTLEHSPPPSKPLDWKSLKKSIVGSLLQAIKAITGGVIALNGQLVKVKGHLLAVKGHLLSTKGDKISEFGKNLATNAFATAHHDSKQSGDTQNSTSTGSTSSDSFSSDSPSSDSPSSDSPSSESPSSESPSSDSSFSDSSSSSSSTSASVSDGPVAVQSSFESFGFPNHHFGQSIELPVGFYEHSGYAKRAAPMYHTPEEDVTLKITKRIL